jgi:large subunit ribosomal protein L20
MSRVKRGTSTHKRHAAVLERAKGFRTGRHALFRRASEALLKAGQFAYRDRRVKKRDMRRGWIVRINAAARQHDVSYSVLMNKLRVAGVAVDRKMLAELALAEPAVFEAIVTKALAA